MYRSILVPLDGSTFAEQALPLGIALTKRCGGRLLLVTVSTPMAEAYVEGMYFSTLELEQEMAGRHEAYLKKISERIQKLHPIPVQTSVQHGEVAATLVDLMGRGDADLAVMATHGRGALSRFWLGSVADEMVRETHVPMILIRPDEETPDLSKEPNLSKIVIPLDGTELAEQVLDHAVRLARVVPGAKIVLMRAINALIPVDMAPDVPEAEREARTILQQVQQLQFKLQQDAESYLQGVAGRIREKGVDVQTHVVVEDQPAVAILQEAEEQKAGLIAIETHGRRGLSRLVQGSVADKVVRGSHIPVLIHHPVSK